MLKDTTKQFSLEGATYPATIKDGLVQITYKEGVLEVAQEALGAIKWGKDVPTPTAGKAP